jgi:hypothetical protein
MPLNASVCPDCQAPLAFGRLSCRECGALLAASSGRTGAARDEAPVEPAGTNPHWKPDVTTAPDGPRIDVELPAAASRTLPHATGLLSPEAVAALLGDVDERAGGPSGWPPDRQQRPAPLEAGRPPRSGEVTGSLRRSASAQDDDGLLPAEDDPVGPAPPTGGLPGAYRPPGRLAAGTPYPGTPVLAPMGPVTGGSIPAADPTTGRAWFSIPVIDEGAISQLARIGSGLAVLGFMFPWASSVIGAAGEGTWFDRWGLANPSHLPVLGLAILLFALEIVGSRIPAWLRTGVLGLVVAGLLAGLAWPYLFGGFTPMIGAYLLGVSSMILVVAGLLAVRPDRHAGPPPTV